MSYLLDTNIISETSKAKPNKSVVEWLSDTPNELLYISTFTIGEIYKGIESLPNNSKKNHLLKWLDNDLMTWFETRIISFDSRAAQTWGLICAKSSRTLAAVDSQIAAIAITHNLDLVTLNRKDYQAISGLKLYKPFT